MAKNVRMVRADMETQGRLSRRTPALHRCLFILWLTLYNQVRKIAGSYLIIARPARLPSDRFHTALELFSRPAQSLQKEGP